MTDILDLTDQREPAIASAQTGKMSAVTLAERAEYQTYERARQTRLLSAILPAGVLLTSAACLVATASLVVNPQQDVSVWINDALTFALAVLFGASWVALRRGRLGA